ncbi:MAG: hypothetical protein Q3997_02530 [Propionibacteriaceae bacterium]|nr:hypothetical protein [Propionibacteriaceae bacterium]
MASGKDVLPQLSGKPSALLMLAQDFLQVSEKASSTLLVSQGLGAFDTVQTWGKATGPARTAEATELQNHVTEASAVYAAAHKALGSVHQQLADSKRTIALAQADWDEAEAICGRKIRAILQDAIDMALTPAEVNALTAKAEQQRDNDQHKAMSNWQHAAELADGAAAEAATSILAALSAFVPTGSRGNPHDIALHLTRNMPLSRDVEYDQHAKDQASAASQLLDRYAGGDQDALAEFISDYGGLSAIERSYFELALADKLGATGFHRLVNSLYIDGSISYLDGGGDYPDGVTAAMGILAGAFVAKGGDPGALTLLGEHTRARAERQRSAWFAELIRRGPQDMPIPQTLGADDRSGGHSDGFWAQAQLLGRAAAGGRNPGDAYFDVVGTALLEYDAAINSLFPPLGQHFVGLVSMPSVWSDDPSGGELAFGADPMYHVLRSAQVRETSAQTFLLNEFSYHTSDGGTATTQALDYLVGARDANPYLHTDQGLIARMVEQYGSKRSPTDHVDVELASRYFSAVIETLDRGTYLGLSGMTLELPGNVFEAARVPLANLMTSHIDAFVTTSFELTALPSRGISELSQKGEIAGYQVGFTLEQVKKLDALYGEIARDRPEQLSYHGAEGHDPNNPPALERVMATALAYHRHKLAADLLSDQTVGNTATAIGRNAEFVFRVINASETALTDEAQKDHVRGFVSAVAKAGAGELPVGTLLGGAIGGLPGAGLGFVADQTWKHTAGAMIDEWATELVQEPVDATKADHKELRHLMKLLYLQQTANVVMATGKWPTEDTPIAFLQKEYGEFPTDSFVNQNGTINTAQIDPGSPKYSAKAYRDFEKFRRDTYLETALKPYGTAIEAGIDEAQQ